MKRRFDLSIAQMACLPFLGAAVTALSLLLVCATRRAAPHEAEQYALFGLALVMMSTGYLILWRAVKSLREGIAAHRWPIESIEAFRKLASSKLWAACSLMLLAFYVLGFLFTLDSPSRSPLRVAGWIAFAFLTALSQLAWTARDPRIFSTASVSTNLNLAQAQPLRSEHWGHS